jgi:gluconate 2-dehydrogenase gamma chain
MDRHEKNEKNKLAEPPPRGPEVSRRTFLKGTGAAAAVASVAVVTGSCDPPAASDGFHAGLTEPPPGTASDPTPPPPAVQPGNVLRFFSPDEAKTVDALTSRLMPGDANDPGAHEAGVVWFIDAALANDGGFNQPIYHDPPFAQSYSGPTPPDNGGFDTLYVPKSEFGRYGYQSALTFSEMYRNGLQSLDAFAKDKFGGRKFTDLNPDEMDSLIDQLAGTSNAGATNISPVQTMAGGEKIGSYSSAADQFFSAPTATDFFNRVRTDTAHGMFADPAYGGNQNLAGWKLIHYPGAQRAYTSQELQTEGAGSRRFTQTLAQMPPFHAGEKINSQVIVPVSGDNDSSGHGGH